jgi:lipopolysaccharide transport system ATP-binding protein
MSEYAIRAQGLGKRYRIGSTLRRHSTLGEAVVGAVNAPLRNLRRLRRLSRFTQEDDADIVWALRDVSFDVGHGEVIGIIGRNGAGKSTLLKILSRITDPSRGRAEVYGRVGSLLEVGTGFHPELTGRDNIYLNGAVLGMSKQYIDRRFEEIVEFAGIRRFVETPVKHYSSGMYLRLAFAVAAHLEPEILIVDEVLAVGDVEFQRKCMGKMDDVAKSGRTVLFVSHSMAAISSLCGRTMLLDQGSLVFSGSPIDAQAEYLARAEIGGSAPLSERTDRQGLGTTRVTAVDIIDAEDRPVAALWSGGDFGVRLRVEAMAPLNAPVFMLTVYDVLGRKLFHCNSSVQGVFGAVPSAEGTLLLTCQIPDLPLPEGEYYLNVAVFCGEVMHDRVENALRFTVTDGDFLGTGRTISAESGAVLVRHRWQVES